MKSFDSKVSLMKQREAELKKNLKKRKINKSIKKKKRCQYSQISGLKKLQKKE